MKQLFYSSLKYILVFLIWILSFTSCSKIVKKTAKESATELAEKSGKSTVKKLIEKNSKKSGKDYVERAVGERVLKNATREQAEKNYQERGHQVISFLWT